MTQAELDALQAIINAGASQADIDRIRQQIELAGYTLDANNIIIPSSGGSAHRRSN